MGGGFQRMIMKIQLRHNFLDIISVENLLMAWQEFIKGKRHRKDVQEFSSHLIDNVLALHCDLLNYTYKHQLYQSFNISDPKPRNIHKATVRDRLLHRAVYRILYPFFNKTFIADSFSCRQNKGTHKALNRFRDFSRQIGQNNTKNCWILQGDIKKFFANIDHQILMKILKQYIPNIDILWLLEKIINSFNSDKSVVGLPLGNLTSQLFVNVYMNEFDQFVKHKLKAKYYIRYADDFVMLAPNRGYLIEQIKPIEYFLHNKLQLTMHPQKVSINTLASGIDFLGWVHFQNHRVLRTTTKRRMIKQVKASPVTATINSYLGLLKHGNTYKLKIEVLKQYVIHQEQKL